MNRVPMFGGMLAMALLAACAEQPTAPTPLESEPFFAAAPAACAASPDFVVSDEAGLRDALAASTPGDVIGIRGTIEVTSNVIIDTPGVTLTCATPGAGLASKGGPEVWAVLFAVASDVRVEGLEIDGSANGAIALYAVTIGELNADRIAFVGNRVRCGRTCLFLVGTQRAVIADNHLEAEYAGSGIHMQASNESRIDGSRIEGNTVVALREVGHPLFGAIRPRDGKDVVVADNVVRGPWSNGIGVAEVANARVERNRVEGVRQFGLFISSNPFNPISTTRSLFRANRLHAGKAPIFARRACDNVIVGNTFPQSAAEWAVVFDASTGSNAFMGNGQRVLDNGSMDCDGDGATDPNVITGTGRISHGRSLGEIVREVMPSVGGQEMR